MAEEKGTGGQGHREEEEAVAASVMVPAGNRHPSSRETEESEAGTTDKVCKR